MQAASEDLGPIAYHPAVGAVLCLLPRAFSSSGSCIGAFHSLPLHISKLLQWPAAPAGRLSGRRAGARSAGPPDGLCMPASSPLVGLNNLEPAAGRLPTLRLPMRAAHRPALSGCFVALQRSKTCSKLCGGSSRPPPPLAQFLPLPSGRARSQPLSTRYLLLTQLLTPTRAAPHPTPTSWPAR